MVRFYGLKVKEGKLTVSDVPKLWREKVMEWLKLNDVE